EARRRRGDPAGRSGQDSDRAGLVLALRRRLTWRLASAVARGRGPTRHAAARPPSRTDNRAGPGRGLGGGGPGGETIPPGTRQTSARRLRHRPSAETTASASY